MYQFVDFLNKTFSPKDFNDLYTDWSEIMKKIEAKYIIRTEGSVPFTNWRQNIKDKYYIKTISQTAIHQEIKKLDINSNYWIVVDLYNNPNEKHRVYDCKPNSLDSIISMYSNGLEIENERHQFVGNYFYIIDKKYNWLTCFEVNKDKGELSILKSGTDITPFE